MHAAGFDYTKISIDIYIFADALNLIAFEWIAILSVCRMIATHDLTKKRIYFDRSRLRTHLLCIDLYC